MLLRLGELIKAQGKLHVVTVLPGCAKLRVVSWGCGTYPHPVHNSTQLLSGSKEKQTNLGHPIMSAGGVHFDQ